MTAATETDTIVKGILLSASDERIELALPHTDYRFYLVPTEPASAFAPHIGRRIKGTIHAQALRIHATSSEAGGGRFIEPVIGMPRIVAGRIKAADQSANRLVVDVTVPFIVTPLPGAEQDWSILDVGRMVNFYVRSGATFTPTLGTEQTAAED